MAPEGSLPECVDFRAVVLKAHSFEEPESPGKVTRPLKPVGYRVSSHGIQDQAGHR